MKSAQAAQYKTSQSGSRPKPDRDATRARMSSVAIKKDDGVVKVPCARAL